MRCALDVHERAPTDGGALGLLDGSGTSEGFPWWRLAVEEVSPVATGAGLRLTEIWTEAGRWFATLVRP